MNRIAYLLCMLMGVIALAACSATPTNTTHTPEQQRSKAQDAQNELSRTLEK